MYRLTILIVALVATSTTWATQKSYVPEADAQAGAAALGLGVGVGDGGDASVKNSTHVKTDASSGAIAGAVNGGNKSSIGIKDGNNDQRVKVVDDSTTKQHVDARDNSVTETSLDNENRTTIVDDSDNSLTDNSSFEYTIPAHADAGFAMLMMQGCYGFGGTDARGSGSQSAGGFTLNLFELTNDRCLLAAKALEAQANGNLDGYATMTCADKATWKAYRAVISAKEERGFFNRASKNESINACVAEIKSVAFGMATRAQAAEEKALRIERELNKAIGKGKK